MWLLAVYIIYQVIVLRNLLNTYLTSFIVLVVKPSYICGDFNINLLNHDTNSDTSNFLNMLASENFYPLITHPKRIKTNSATLIDNIFYKYLEQKTLLV